MKTFFELSKKEISKLKIDPNLDFEKQKKSIQMWITKTVGILIKKGIEKKEVNSEFIQSILKEMFGIDITITKEEITEDILKKHNFMITQTNTYDHIMKLISVILKGVNTYFGFEEHYLYRISGEGLGNEDNDKFGYYAIEQVNNDHISEILENKNPKQKSSKLNFRLIQGVKKIQGMGHYFEYVYLLCVHYFVVQTLLKLTNQEEYGKEIYEKTKFFIKEISSYNGYLQFYSGTGFKFIDKLYSLRYVKYDKKINFGEIFEKILLGGYLYETNEKYIFRESYSGERKEYAKVYQQENLRVKNKTDEILQENVLLEEDTLKDKENSITGKKAIGMFKYKQLQELVSSFKGIEIDENTNLDELNSFFVKFYYIIEDIQLYLKEFGVDIKKDILPRVFFKIRKLGQYKANGIFFSGNNTLALDIRGRESIVHELGHLIHYNLGDILGENKLKFVGCMTNNLIKNDFADIKNKQEIYQQCKKLQFLISLYTDKKQISETNKYGMGLQYMSNKVYHCYDGKCIRPDTQKIDQRSNSLNHVYWPAFHEKLLLEYKKVEETKLKYSSYIISSTEIFARFFDLMIRTRLSKKGIQIRTKIGQLESFDYFLIQGVFGTFKSLGEDIFHKRLNDFFKAFYYYILYTFKKLKKTS